MELSRFKEKIFNFKVLLMGVENYLMRLNSPILKKNCMVQITPPFFFFFWYFYGSLMKIPSLLLYVISCMIVNHIRRSFVLPTNST
ncbi:hypothetical protein CISIN_1g034738mg [Citrus sinensis]|uniref:Uncharacterized protein n=1 Tax=Citrus sinensis TaxID=2711 RepID=A0A067GMC5_CITSI|nr:hypothetical protein CISIN_1g034738mg [Citrus sinensis]